MKPKRIPDPSHLRRCPKQFSWIDHRLVRLGHVRGRSAHALALYLILVAVGDADGVSWYGDERLGLELGCSVGTLHKVRDELTDAGLIAYDRPFYQVLELADQPATMPQLGDALDRLAHKGERG
ncbi:MAG: hypothetical protein KAI66_27110 [Lentisphaeria bacterium]|nr:hypothetical protein [Lentisphaeria bacterium]